MIFVTKPFLPPREEYEEFIQSIWDRNWLTNHGPLVKSFEKEVNNHLGTSNFSFVSNGTIALQLAIRALDLKGDIITTPFSYVATTSSIVWENCHPIFIDIDAETLNIDPAKIEAAITDNTSAILATHVYGNPCDIDAIQKIADQHGLKVIYDAAHCFGTTFKGQPIFEYGDLSTISFHATKVMHSTEGGGVFTKSDELNYRITRLRNFGHNGPEEFDGLGINGKNSEFHAAMGLVNLRYIDRILEKRKADFDLYLAELDNSLTFPKMKEGANFSYFPVIFNSESNCLKVFDALAKADIHARRYFYPVLSDLDYIEGQFELPVANDISKRILCLPMFYDLDHEQIQQITLIINKTIS